jgi:hypothetical protein
VIGCEKRNKNNCLFVTILCVSKVENVMGQSILNFHNCSYLVENLLSQAATALII